MRCLVAFAQLDPEAVSTIRQSMRVDLERIHSLSKNISARYHCANAVVENPQGARRSGREKRVVWLFSGNWAVAAFRDVSQTFRGLR